MHLNVGNVALGQKSFASSNSWGAGAANDGNCTTFWYSTPAASAPQWWNIDLQVRGLSLARGADSLK